MISVDISLLYQMAAFLIMLYILTKLIFKPIIALLEERKEKTEGTFAGAAAVEAEIADGNAAFEKRIKDAELKAQDERAAIRQTALDEQKEFIEETREGLQSDLVKVKEELLGEKNAVLETLILEAPKISKVIAEKMLERALPLLILVFAMLLPTIAFASSDGGGNNDMLWKVINFIVLIIGVGFLWKKVIKGLLINRAKDIETKLAEAEVKRLEAEKLLAEYKQKESGFAALISEAEARIKKDIEFEKEKIRGEAAVMIEKLKAQARFTTEEEIKRARREIKAEAADVAMEMAMKIINREIRPDDQDRLVKTYIDKMRLN
jgi:F-type H+-transporting ATPase subunit b